ncbi:hypothetical protein, partial [Stenotrophomonas sp.]|uniref:hypothetical protein n=1 Tax=Stenotrophomonas sp. TaxID=69392 RepID=UPI0025D99A5C
GVVRSLTGPLAAYRRCHRAGPDAAAPPGGAAFVRGWLRVINVRRTVNSIGSDGTQARLIPSACVRMKRPKPLQQQPSPADEP